MPKLKNNQKPKGSINARVDQKLKYGLDLVAKKRHISLSDALVQAIVAYLESDGLAAKQEGDKPSILDEIWSDSELLRTCFLAQLAPIYASKEDITLAEYLISLSDGVKIYLEEGKPYDGYGTRDIYIPDDRINYLKILISIIEKSPGNINILKESLNCDKLVYRQLWQEILCPELDKIKSSQ